MNAREYWAARYSEEESLRHHARQNYQLATDFTRLARFYKAFGDALSSKRIIEIGCGSGELAAVVNDIYHPDVYYATDFCREAVEAAQRRHLQVNFWKFDILEDEPFDQFDLLICSNTLEHFTDPWSVIDRMFKLAPLLILVVPYQQPVTDGYDNEGGAGHVFEFNIGFFGDYEIHDSFTFTSRGWQHELSTHQFAILISEKQT